jgi:hypothetical protein
MTGDPDIKPKPWEPGVQLVSAVGTCDPEVHRRYMSGGMATIDPSPSTMLEWEDLNDTSTITPKAQGAAVSVKALDQKLLLGSLGSSTGLRIVYSNMLLFYVPESGSDEKIRLVGASQGLLSVRSIN